jgi:hypothetical protein
MMERKCKCSRAVHKLYTDIMKAYGSVRRAVFYNILIAFGLPMKPIWLIKIFLNKTYNKFHIHKNLSDAFPIQNDMKQGDALLPLLFNFSLEYVIKEGPRKSGRAGIEWNTSTHGLCQ